jgi:hypothetical protein
MLHYDPNTGHITNDDGTLATRPHPRGYLYVYEDGRTHLAHRWIWTKVHGPIPPTHVVDHVNRDKTDNRQCNLRLATQSQNTANAEGRSNSTSGYRGVSKRGAKWQAYINLDGKRKHLGYYLTPELAYKAHVNAARAQWGEHYNGAQADPSFVPYLPGDGKRGAPRRWKG